MQQVLVNELTPNLFRALLPYRGREGRDSHENFLTEAFAHFLATQQAANIGIVEKVVSNRFSIEQLVSIETQKNVSHEASGTRCIPDIQIRARDNAGSAVEIWIENKWASPASSEQLSRYLDAMAKRSRKDNVPRHLALLTPRIGDRQVMTALKAPHRLVTLSGISWPEIHELMAAATLDAIGAELVVFMKEEGLGHLELLTRAEVSDDFRLLTKAGKSHPFRQKLRRLCNMLLNEPQIAGMAALKDAETHDAWGRACIFTADGKVSLGFLYDPTDHATAFLDPNMHLDICIRIEGNYDRASVAAERAEFSWLVARLDDAGFDCDISAGRWRSNKHTILLGHYRAGFPFGQPTAQAQYQAIMGVFYKSFSVVFSDATAVQQIQRLKSW